MTVKASALYIVIVIALVIGVLCSALIVSAYFYRMQYQKTFRYDRLKNNLESASNILLSVNDTSYNAGKTFSLFNMDNDSVSVQKINWGTFDICLAKAFIQKDTLYNVFSVNKTIDSAKWAAIYLADNQRPLALSGKTAINGDVFISPAGVDQAFVNNQAYTGDKRLIIGTKHSSEKVLPPLDPNRLLQLNKLLSQDRGHDSTLLKNDSMKNSFFSPTRVFNFGKQVEILANVNLSGNIILFSDTSLDIDSTALLKNVIIFAKSITVHKGFHGQCQLFAVDTIGIEPNCRFSYPSSLAILRFNPSSILNTQAKISLQANSTFKGLIFTYEKKEGPIHSSVHIGSKVIIKGMVYSQGNIELKDNAEIDGAVFCTGFLYQTTYTLFENYLINVKIDEKALSPYYLTSSIVPVATQKNRVLEWLEKN